MSAEMPISAVTTTLAIIETMAERGEPIGVSELAKLVGANKPKAYRHLRTLVSHDYVAQDPETDKYFLTLKTFHIGQAIAERAEFLVEARRVLPRLRELSGQTVAVGQIEDAGVRILDILRHRAAIEITTTPGTLFEFHCSAQGKIALAFGDKAHWGRVTRLAGSGHKIDLQDLQSGLTAVREQGWAVAPEESLIGVNALAAPVFNASRQLAGTIAIVGSIQYLSPQPDVSLIAAVKDAAQTVSERLGYPGNSAR